MKFFVNFMGSSAGRIIRVVGGAGLIAWGLLGLSGVNGYIVAAVGVVPMLTGLFNICLVGPLFGAPLSGRNTRSATQ